MAVDRPVQNVWSLGVPRVLLLSIQHVLAMFGATVLVPVLIGTYFSKATGQPLTSGPTVGVTLTCAGLGTLLFFVCTKCKVPAFLGSSFAFLGGFETIANFDTGMYAAMDANMKASYACGGIVAAGLMYVVLALIVAKVGAKKVMRFLPPIVTGPVIICIGISLAGSAVSNASTCWPLAILTVLAVVLFNIYGKGMIKSMPILLGVVVACIAAAVMNLCGMTNADGTAILDFAAVSEAHWVGVPDFNICRFDLSAILVMAPIAIATMMEHVGDISAISATVGEDFIEDPGLHWTLVGDGLATSISGFFGGPANTTYSENTGVLVLSQVYDPIVIGIAAAIAVVLGFIPKVSAVVSAMPTAIIGGISFVLYSMIAAVGVRNIKENNVNFTNTRNLIIAGMIMICGNGFEGGITFQVGSATITLTALAIAAVVGIVLNAVLPGRDD